MLTGMTDRIPTDKECIDLLWDAGCKKRVVVHCATVRAVAEVIAEGIPQADMDLVIAGALLHDIGRSKDHSIMHRDTRLVLEKALCIMRDEGEDACFAWLKSLLAKTKDTDYSADALGIRDDMADAESIDRNAERLMRTDPR